MSSCCPCNLLFIRKIQSIMFVCILSDAAHTETGDNVVGGRTETPNSPQAATSQTMLKLRSLLSTEELNSPGFENGSGTPTYMNVTPGEAAAAMSAGRFSRMNSNFSTISAAERCYENLDPSMLAALVADNCKNNNNNNNNSSTNSNNASTTGVTPFQPHPGNGRNSRPDIFAKIDLPVLSSGAAKNNSNEQQAGPTVNANRVNYIVLDLDNQQQQQQGTALSQTTSITAVTTPGGLTKVGQQTTIRGTTGTAAAGEFVGGVPPLGSGILLMPDSPKKATMLGYATIDFNKTVALSNTTNPPSDVDAEGSRKTRHSASMSGTAATVQHQQHQTSHPIRLNSNSISD